MDTLDRICVAVFMAVSERLSPRTGMSLGGKEATKP